MRLVRTFRRNAAPILAALIAATLVVAVPATAHITGKAGHNWNKHYKKLAEKSFFTKKQANNRFLQTGQGLRLEPTATTPNVIGGSADNDATAGVVGAAIGGGGNLPNRVTDDFGTVGGGENNQAGDDDIDPTDATFATVGGGEDNIASGFRSTVGGGSFNTASGSFATVGGGNSNTAVSSSTVAGGVSNSSTGSSSTVGGGNANSASGTFATVPGGARGAAPLYGQLAHASGLFAATGDAQTSEFVLRNETSNNTATELFLDGVDDRLTLADGRKFFFDAMIVGATSGGTSGETNGYRITGLIERNGTTTTLLNDSVENLFEEDAAWAASVTADNTNEALKIEVTGDGTNLTRWVALVRTIEVLFP